MAKSCRIKNNFCSNKITGYRQGHPGNVSDSCWILDTGFWSDSCFWHDEEVWID